MITSEEVNKFNIFIPEFKLTFFPPECGCDDSAIKRDNCPELHSIQTYYAHSEGEGHAKHVEKSQAATCIIYFKGPRHPQ